MMKMLQLDYFTCLPQVEEMEMLKGIPRAARDAVLRSLERQKAGTGTQPYENQ